MTTPESSLAGALRPRPGRPSRWLPSPVSANHGVAVVLLGFAVEGGTEAYQFLASGSLGQGWLVYYTSLATTILGFFLMFLGFREWYAFHPRPTRATPVPWLLIQLFATAFLRIGLWVGLHSRRLRRKHFLGWALAMVAAVSVVVVATVMVDRVSASRPPRYVPWIGLSLWAGGTGSTAWLSIALGYTGAGATPLWVAWPVGGLIVVAFGSFFFGLRRLAEPFGSSTTRSLGWGGFAWSLAVGTVAGLALGERVLELLTELVTNWSALVDSAAPIVVAMSPLFLTYAMMVGAFWPMLHRSGGGTDPARSSGHRLGGATASDRAIVP